MRPNDTVLDLCFIDISLTKHFRNEELQQVLIGLSIGHQIGVEPDCVCVSSCCDTVFSESWAQSDDTTFGHCAVFPAVCFTWTSLCYDILFCSYGWFVRSYVFVQMQGNTLLHAATHWFLFLSQMDNTLISSSCPSGGPEGNLSEDRRGSARQRRRLADGKNQNLPQGNSASASLH